jgi:hypothetical protein
MVLQCTKKFFSLFFIFKQHIALKGSSFSFLGYYRYLILSINAAATVNRLLYSQLGPEFKQPWLLLRPLAACQENQLPRLLNKNITFLCIHLTSYCLCRFAVRK